MDGLGLMRQLGSRNGAERSRYREIGIDEFILYWWREDAIEYGYERLVVERCANREMLEHLASETIPKLRASD